MEQITRKTLLYKTGVEYGDYTINHIEGCSHGCLYPCYAMLMAKRFGKIKTYKDWLKPKIVSNSLQILEKEIPRYQDKIKFVQLCFTTDPFMYNFPEISKLSFNIIKRLNKSNIKCTALSKGLLPIELAQLNPINEFGITLITINDNFRQKLEPYASPMKERIQSLYNLHKKKLKTWVSIEPYPTPNIINQNLDDILDTLDFVDKIIFGRLNYNSKVSNYKSNKEFFNEMATKIISFAKKNKKQYYIKEGTITKSLNYVDVNTTDNSNQFNQIGHSNVCSIF
jgi:DNA repair photolyase